MPEDRIQNDSYDEQEAEQRLIAALRGAQKPRTQMKDIPRKRPYKPRKQKPRDPAVSKD